MPKSLFHGEVATWVTPSIRSTSSLLFSADAMASEFSGMGKMHVGGDTVSFTDDGGPESRACAKQMFKVDPSDFWPNH